MTIRFKQLYRFAFLIITLLCFLIGGTIQYFLGIPNTVYTFFVTAVFILFYFIYALVVKRIYWDRVIAFFSVYALVIVVSSLVNQTPLIKTTIYLVFVLMPLSTYLFFKINQRKSYISQRDISRIYLFLAFIQLPIILFQKYGYDFLIAFNSSNQFIAREDFMFGTFFIKADHAMGFFLLMNILNLIENNKKLKITSFPIFTYSYLGFTVLIAESNVSKVLLLLLIAYMVFMAFPKKVRIISFFLAIMAIPILVKQAKSIDAVKTEIYFLETQYNVSKSWENYERGIAKRPQVVIAYASKIPTKFIGDGPYSYFNILEGKFGKAKHFSQLLWTYVDLGVIGLLVLLPLLFVLIKSFNLSTRITLLLFFTILIYAFMTTIFSDLAIMIALVGIFQKTNRP